MNRKGFFVVVNVKPFVVLVVIAVLAAFVCLVGMCDENSEKETGKDTVLENNKRNGPEAPIVLPKRITNGIGMAFAYIPPTGDKGFMMGSALSPEEVEKRYGGDAKYHEDERPQHKVVLTRGFYLQTTEVTQKQWKAIMGKNPSHFKGDDLPVESTSWNDVRLFIMKVNKNEGTDKYRLPTEAEWEYACRAGSTTAFYWGNSGDEIDEYCWYGDNSDKETHPVGKKKPNAWGLYDMCGNVYEWCQDFWDGNYYENSPEKDPRGPEGGKYRVLRGGGFNAVPWSCRSADRCGFKSGFGDPHNGFRLLREAD